MLQQSEIGLHRRGSMMIAVQKLLVKTVAPLSAAFLVVIGAACSDKDPAGPGTEKTVPGITVSEPHADIAANISVPGRATVIASSIAYVSAEPGTIPQGFSIKIRNTSADGTAVSATIIDGGFDPVTIEAKSGDELSLSVKTVDDRTIEYTVTVPPRRPPIVVRTNPQKGRVDVALTQLVSAVFSEPVDPNTVNATSFRLLKGSVPVAGTLAVSADGLTADFDPSAGLDPQTTYTLIIGKEIRDRDGDVLAEAETISFTTAAGVGPTNGPASIRIVFQRNDEAGPGSHIESMNGDGTNRLQLTDGPNDVAPAVSPDGKRIAFVRSGDVTVMNVDGSDVRQLPAKGDRPAWSPDGTRLVFGDPTTTGLSVINTDGTGIVHLTDASVPEKEDGQASWSPDGKMIAFWRWVGLEFSLVYVMNADGTGVTQLGRRDGNKIWACWSPVWSPDSRRIAFGGPSNFIMPALFTMDADGGNVNELASGLAGGVMANPTDWSESNGILFHMSSNGGSDIYLYRGSITRITNDGRSSYASFLTR